MRARSLPPLWLELRPTRAIAVQPRVDASAVTVTVGIEAETRITSAQTKPDCPFPDKISIIPPTPAGVSIGVPIDLPFTEINKILETQFAGKTFPEDGSGSVDVTVKQATVAASGDRLLISLLVHAKEKKSWFGFGADATVQIWGRPVLDQAQQTLRLTDVQLAVESEAALGLLGAAAREAMPHLQQALADKAVHRPQAVRGQCAEKDRGRDRRFPEERGRRAGGGGNHQPAACLHRFRFQDAARDRGSRGHAQRQRHDVSRPLTPENLHGGN